MQELIFCCLSDAHGPMETATNELLIKIRVALIFVAIADQRWNKRWERKRVLGFQFFLLVFGFCFSSSSLSSLATMHYLLRTYCIIKAQIKATHKKQRAETVILTQFFSN